MPEIREDTDIVTLTNALEYGSPLSRGRLRI